MASPLTEAEINARLSELDGWRRDGERLLKQFSFDNYLAGLAFASAVGVLCEGANHHPDLTIGWRRVEVSFTTHDAGNQLSEKDFAAAAGIDALGYPK